MKMWGEPNAPKKPNRKPSVMKHTWTARIGAMVCAFAIAVCFGVSAFAEAPEQEAASAVVQSESAAEPSSAASATEETSGTPESESPSSPSGVNSSSSGDGVPPVSVPGENPEPQSEVQSESQSESESVPESESQPVESAPVSSKAQPEEAGNEELAPQAAGNGTISGKVWLDENTNGVWDAEEDALQGIELALFKADDLGTALASATSDENGAYSFEALEEGDYKVGVAAQKIDDLERLIPMKMIQKGADNKFNADFSTDPIMATSESLTLAADGEVKDVDAGMRGKPKVSLLASYTINLASPSSGTGYTYNGTDTITFNTAANAHDYTIIGDGTTLVTAINFDTGVNTTLTLSGMTLGSPALRGFITLGTNSNVTLLLAGNNIIHGAITTATSTISNASLTIDSASGSGSTNGLLDITTRPYTDYYASIGACYGNAKSSTITINGGTIKTWGGDKCAGIGGGTSYGEGGTITINGGDVTSKGGYSGAGIGGGSLDKVGWTIAISGGKVFATGVNGAGIGSGVNALSLASSSITITGGTVTALGTMEGAGIGGGQNSPSASYMQIDKEATVLAYTCSLNKLALDAAADNAGTAYYVMNQPYQDQGKLQSYYLTHTYTIDVYNTVGPPVLQRTLSFSGDISTFIKSYAYTNGESTSREYLEVVFDITRTYVGSHVRRFDSLPRVYSVNSYAGYSAHDSVPRAFTFPGSLPVQRSYGYLVTYVGNNGNNEPNHYQLTADEIDTDITIETVTAASFTPPTSPPGYVFTGWNTQANGSGTAYTPGQFVTLTGNLTLYAQWGPPAADVTVSKTITGSFADLTKQFTFTATVWDKTNTTLAPGTPFAWSVNTGTTSVNGAAAAASGTLTLQAGGKATFKLGHGQSITIEDIPSDGYIQIDEQTDALYSTSHTSGAGYSFSKIATDTNPGNTDKQAMNANDMTVAYTNTRIYVPPTGVDPGSRATARLGFTTALALAAVGATAWYIRRRRGVKGHG